MQPDIAQLAEGRDVRTRDLFIRSTVNVIPTQVRVQVQSGSSEVGIFAGTTIESPTGAKWRACRLLERSSEFHHGYLAGGGVIVFRADSGGSEYEIVEFIPRGEDPRLFLHRGRAYIYYHTYNQTLGCSDLWMMCLEPISSPLLFDSSIRDKGKNWSPFEYSRQLYFAYCLDPLTLVREVARDPVTIKWDLLEDEAHPPEWRWGARDEAGYGSEYRGGTRGVERDQRLYFFGHRTHQTDYENLHTLFVIRYEPQYGNLRRLELTCDIGAPLLCDPFGVQERMDGFFDLDLSIATGFVHDPRRDLSIAKVTYRIDLLDEKLDEQTAEDAPLLT